MDSLVVIFREVDKDDRKNNKGMQAGLDNFVATDSLISRGIILRVIDKVI